MKKGIIACQILLLLLPSCNSVRESDFFAFDVDEFRDIAAEPLHLDVQECSANLFTAAINDRYIYSYESSKDWLYTLTDIETDEIVCKMGHRGRGPDEFINVFPLQDFFVEDGETKTLMFCYNDARLFTWNITRSLETGKEVYENRMYLGDSTKYLPLGSLHPLEKDKLLVRDTKQNPHLDEMVAPPVYAVYDLKDRSIIRTYDLFIDPGVKSQNKTFSTKTFLGVNDSMKPDRTKVAMAMYYFPQINILDVESGECRGFRIKGARKFSPAVQFCQFGPIASDDEHIYALYCGKEVDYSNYDVTTNTLYVFNWNGELLRKFRIDAQVLKMSINKSDNKMYFYHQERPYLYTIDMDRLSGLI